MLKNFNNQKLKKFEKGTDNLTLDELLKCSEEKSLYVEEYSREMIKTEEMHSIEIKKLLRDYDQ